MTEDSAARGKPAPADQNGYANGNGHERDGETARAPRSHDLPGDVKRRIDSGEAPDPMWYVGRVGPSVQDVLDADGDELARLQKLEQPLPHNGNGNGKPTRNRRHRQTSS